MPRKAPTATVVIGRREEWEDPLRWVVYCGGGGETARELLKNSSVPTVGLTVRS
jgi:hypothetical protein